MKYCDKFSFNQVFRSKTSCGFAYRADFLRFLCVTQILVGRGSSYSNFPPQPRLHPPPPPFLFEQPISHGFGQIRPQIFWVIQPTSREVTDFKKAVSQRVKNVESLLKMCNLTKFVTLVSLSSGTGSAVSVR
jgi:hypothetical protein